MICYDRNITQLRYFMLMWPYHRSGSKLHNVRWIQDFCACHQLHSMFPFAHLFHTHDNLADDWDLADDCQAST